MITRAVWGALLAGAILVAPGQVCAATITFAYHGTVGTFIDTDNVYGFGVGANLAGKSVTDTYIVDTSSANSSFTFGSNPGGQTYQLWLANLPAGASSATSDIGGHTVSWDLNVFNYAEQLTTPAAPYDMSLIESQGIGFETTGTAIGTEFLIRDEALSYSHVIPLALSSSYYLTPSILTENGNTGGLIYQSVFFPYQAGATVGDFDITSISVNRGVPEAGTWALLLAGLGGLTLLTRRKAAFFGCLVVGR